MGNKAGWIIAGVVGLCLVIAIVWAIAFPPPSKPTYLTLAPGALDLKGADARLGRICPEPTGSGNAADDYARAIEAHQANLDAIEKCWLLGPKIRDGQAPMPADGLAAVQAVYQHVAAGAAKKDMQYYFSHTPRAWASPYDCSKDVNRFQQLMDVCKLMSYHHTSQGPGSYGQAEKALFDLVRMGDHCVRERGRLELVTAGVAFQRIAIDELGLLYKKWGKNDRLAALNEHRQAVQEISDSYRDHLRTIHTLKMKPDGGSTLANPGDVFNLAANHKDRCIRIEAGVFVGAIRLTAERRGDRRYAAKLGSQMARSGDPLEAAAGQAAMNMTQADLNRLATGASSSDPPGM